MCFHPNDPTAAHRAPILHPTIAASRDPESDGKTAGGRRLRRRRRRRGEGLAARDTHHHRPWTRAHYGEETRSGEILLLHLRGVGGRTSGPDPPPTPAKAATGTGAGRRPATAPSVPRSVASPNRPQRPQTLRPLRGPCASPLGPLGLWTLYRPGPFSYLLKPFGTPILPRGLRRCNVPPHAPTPCASEPLLNSTLNPSQPSERTEGPDRFPS